MAAQVVTESQVSAFLLVTPDAKMDVMCAGPFDWLLKEWIDGVKGSQRNVAVAELSQRLRVTAQRIKHRDGDLYVNDGFRRKARYCGGPDMLNAQREASHCVADASRL